MVVADLVAGTLAGFGICGVGHPFDTLKVLMQMQPDKYKGMGDALKETVSKHGPMGLYKGVGAPLVGNGFYNAVQFAIFGSAKKWFTNDGKSTEPWRVAGAGAFTGIFVALVEGPQDLCKSQIQATMVSKPAEAGVAPAPPKYSGVGDCARQIIAQRGFMGATQGLSATIARNVIGVSAYFYFYEVVRKALAGPTRKVEDLSPLEVLAAGFSGGMGYWVLCYPLDIIKSAIQTDSIDPAQRKYKTLPQTAALLWKEGGVKRFTAGLAPCLARAGPANATGFLVYELASKALK